MTYATLREALYDFFLHTMPHLFPTAVIIVVKMSSPHCRMKKEGGILMRLPCSLFGPRSGKVVNLPVNFHMNW